MVQLSYPYVTAGKTITLTIPTFVSKMMSLLFNMLSRFVIAFLPRSKHLLIFWFCPLLRIMKMDLLKWWIMTKDEDRDHLSMFISIVLGGN